MILFNEESPNYSDINYDFPDATTSNPQESPTISQTALPPVTVEHPHNKSKPKHYFLKSKHSKISLRFEKFKDRPSSCGEDEINYRTSTGSNEDNMQKHKHTHIFPILTSISINCIIGADTLKTITIQLSQDVMISTIIDKAMIEFNKEFQKRKRKLY